MKVILQQDVKGLGKKGEIVEASDGYARNFLLPKKMAVEANKQNVSVANAKAGSAARKKAQDNDEAKLMAAQLAKLEVTLKVRVGEGGKLFGSVTGKDVAAALKADHGIEIEKRKISLNAEVTAPGEYEAVIKVHPEITAKVKVNVVAE